MEESPLKTTLEADGYSSRAKIVLFLIFFSLVLLFLSNYISSYIYIISIPFSLFTAYAIIEELIGFLKSWRHRVRLKNKEIPNPFQDILQKKESQENKTNKIIGNKVLFAEFKGVDFNNVEFNSKNIALDLSNDIDGKWYFVGEPMVMLMKKFSDGTHKNELHKILKENKIDIKSVKTKILPNQLGEIQYWETNNNQDNNNSFPSSFAIESSEDKLITIINTSLMHTGTKLEETNLTDKIHNLEWIKGIKIYDGKKAMQNSRGWHEVKYVPLLFQDQENDYILIPEVTHLNIAKVFIDQIIEKNGGKDKFKDDTSSPQAVGWEYLFRGDKFCIGYVTKYSVVRVNKL